MRGACSGARSWPNYIVINLAQVLANYNEVVLARAALLVLRRVAKRRLRREECDGLVELSLLLPAQCGAQPTAAP